MSLENFYFSNSGSDSHGADSDISETSVNFSGADNESSEADADYYGADSY